MVKQEVNMSINGNPLLYFDDSDPIKKKPRFWMVT